MDDIKPKENKAYTEMAKNPMAGEGLEKLLQRPCVNHDIAWLGSILLHGLLAIAWEIRKKK